MDLIQKLQYQFERKSNFLRWIFIRKKEFYEIHKSKMYLFPNDKGISYDLILYGDRERESYQFTKTLLKKDFVAFDIGANIGYYVILESKMCKKVYAIEPEISNFNLLNKNISLNKLSNVITFNKAISDKLGDIDFFISVKSNMHSIYSDYKDNNIVEKIKVKALSLDEFCIQNNVYPDFLRMDIQGGEYQVFKGMNDILKKSLIIFMELHPQMMKEEHTLYILNTLKTNGFDVIKMFKDYNVTMSKFKSDFEYDYNINELINDVNIINGTKGTFELFLQKKPIKR